MKATAVTIAVAVRLCPFTFGEDNILSILFILTLRKLTLDLFSQLINFVWLRLTTSIKRICYDMLCYVQR